MTLVIVCSSHVGDVQELIAHYSSELQLSNDVVTDAVESLRQHAVNRLTADTQFTQTGVATVHVKFAGKLPPQVCLCTCNFI